MAPIVPMQWEFDEFCDRALDPSSAECFSAAFDAPLVLVHLAGDVDAPAGLADAISAMPAVVTALAEPGDDSLTGLFDVVLATSARDELDDIASVVARCPVAAVSFAMLLRAQPGRSLDHALAAESAVYSLLQAGPEFRSWLSTRPTRPAPPPRDRVVAALRAGVHDEELHITLDRPERRNALSAQLRDEWAELLRVAPLDPTIERIVIEGNGPAFCAGGDLDEFGTFVDPASAHVVRLTRSLGRLLARSTVPIEVRLHGACMGSGIELPAFAGTVVADPDSTVIGLPEVSLGLVPGAGGTVSLTRRIGRQRTAWLGLTGRRVDAATALEWGLVDVLEAVTPPNL